MPAPSLPLAFNFPSPCTALPASLAPSIYWVLYSVLALELSQQLLPGACVSLYTLSENSHRDKSCRYCTFTGKIRSASHYGKALLAADNERQSPQKTVGRMRETPLGAPKQFLGSEHCSVITRPRSSRRERTRPHWIPFVAKLHGILLSAMIPMANSLLSGAGNGSTCCPYLSELLCRSRNSSAPTREALYKSSHKTCYTLGEDVKETLRSKMLDLAHK